MVGVIVVTYNGIQWIKRCLKLISESTVETKVFIIDNGSTDGTIKCIEDNFPDYFLIKSNSNLGFGKANNIGILRALSYERIDFVALINQDLYIERDTLERCLEISKKNPQFGVLSPIQMNGSGTCIDQNFKYNYSLSQKRKVVVNDIQEMNFIMAAFWFLPKKCLKQVGGFDEIFTHYGEDNDLINRIKYHGWKVGALPNLKVYHDRFYRKTTNIKKLQIYYTGILANLTNVNSSFSKAIISSSILILKEFVKTSLQMDRDLFFENFFQIRNLILKSKHIKKSRIKNKISLTG